MTDPCRGRGMGDCDASSVLGGRRCYRDYSVPDTDGFCRTMRCSDEGQRKVCETELKTEMGCTWSEQYAVCLGPGEAPPCFVFWEEGSCPTDRCKQVGYECVDKSDPRPAAGFYLPPLLPHHCSPPCTPSLVPAYTVSCSVRTRADRRTGLQAFELRATSFVRLVHVESVVARSPQLIWTGQCLVLSPSPPLLPPPFPLFSPTVPSFASPLTRIVKSGVKKPATSGYLSESTKPSGGILHIGWRGRS